MSEVPLQCLDLREPEIETDRETETGGRVVEGGSMRGPYRDGPASGENISHLCRLKISGYCSSVFRLGGTNTGSSGARPHFSS